MSDFTELRETSTRQIYHEDGLFSGRIRNFLMATAFLVTGYAASSTTLSVHWPIPILGVVLSCFYLRIGVRSAQAIRIWRVIQLYSEERLADAGMPRYLLPERYIRKPKYDKFIEENFWSFFGDTNALQGLWVPAICVWFWLFMIGDLLYKSHLQDYHYASILVLIGWIILLMSSLIWIRNFQTNLKVRYPPEEAAEWLKTESSEQPNAQKL